MTRCKTCGHEIENKTIKLKIFGKLLEIEKELHTEMNKASLVTIPDGWRLLELSEWIELINNYKDKFDWGINEYADEIVSQPKKDIIDKYPYWNVWLHRIGSGNRSNLVGYNRILDCGNVVVRGVRFCREVKK